MPLAHIWFNTVHPPPPPPPPTKKFLNLYKVRFCCGFRILKPLSVGFPWVPLWRKNIPIQQGEHQHATLFPLKTGNVYYHSRAIFRTILRTQHRKPTGNYFHYGI